MRKIKPKYNDTRVKRMFLLFPKTLNCSVHENVSMKRWLEFADVYQEYRLIGHDDKWVDVRWNDV